MQLEDCYLRLREYCAGIEPEYRYYSWEHARRLRDAAYFQRRLHHWNGRSFFDKVTTADDLVLEAVFIEERILSKTYAAIKPGIQTGKRS